MDNWPDVFVGIPGYNRPDTVRITIAKLLINLRYKGKVTIVVSEDGDYEKMAEAILKTELPQPELTSYHPHRHDLYPGPGKGLGANLNHLLNIAAYADHKIIMLMDDDHWLEKPLDISPHVKQLMECPEAGWIRLYGIGHHNLVGDLNGRYWHIRWNSPDLYITSFRPHIKHVRFHEHFGNYPEGRSLAQTEEGFCHQCKDIASKKGGPKVLVPLLGDLDWSHGVGTTSWQLKGH